MQECRISMLLSSPSTRVVRAEPRLKQSWKQLFCTLNRSSSLELCDGIQSCGYEMWLIKLFPTHRYPPPTRPPPKIQRCDFRNLGTAYGMAEITVKKFNLLLKTKWSKIHQRFFSGWNIFRFAHGNKSCVVLQTRPSPTKSCYWKNCLEKWSMSINIFHLVQRLVYYLF